jgi:cation:H+ antiporter
MIIILTNFLISVLFVIIAGVGLSKFADVIADKLNLGKALVGGVLLAGATSLPELLVDINSIKIGMIDLAAGDLLGSSLFNLLILAIADLLHKSKRGLFSKTSSVHALSASISIALTAVVGMLIVLGSKLSNFRLGHVGLGSVSLFLIYAFGMRMVYADQKKTLLNNLDSNLKSEIYSLTSLRMAIIGFLLSVLVLFIAAPLLSDSASEISQITGLSGTFVGTTLVAFSTSLPELVSTIAAVRMGAFDLALGNIYGSNAFNMILFLPLDFLLTEPIWNSLSSAHILTVLAIILCSSISIMGQVYQIEDRKKIIEPDAFTIIIIVIGSLFLLYKYNS